MRIVGAGASPQIDGTLMLDNVKTKVDFTGVTYKVDALRLDFVDNVGTLATTQVNDEYGGRALLSGELNMADLNSVKYNVQLLPTSLAVIDLASSPTAPFCSLR